MPTADMLPARVPAPNGDRYLFTHHSWHTSRDGVWHFPRHTSADLDGLRVVNRFTNRIWHLLDSLFGYISANGIRHLLGMAFFDHPADLIITDFCSFFRDHFADFVGTGSGPFFRYHLADFVGAGSGSFFRNHSADFVATFLSPLLINISANRVRDFFFHNFSLISHAVYGFFFNFLNPYLFAYFSGRALDFFDTAFARHKDTAATARIPFPTARFTNTLTDHRARDFLDFCYPASATNLNRFGVLHRLADRTALFSVSSFSDRFTNGIANGPSLGFPNRLADRITNRFLTRFPYGFADRIANRFLTRFPYGFADGVAYCPLTGFPNGLSHGVITGLVSRFIDRFSDCIATFPIPSFRYVLHTVNLLIFVDLVVHGLVAGVLLLFINDFSAGLHHGVAMLFGTPIVGFFGAAAVLVTGGTEVASSCQIRGERYQRGDHPQNSASHSHLLLLAVISLLRCCFFGRAVALVFKSRSYIGPPSFFERPCKADVSRSNLRLRTVFFTSTTLHIYLK